MLSTGKHAKAGRQIEVTETKQKFIGLRFIPNLDDHGPFSMEKGKEVISHNLVSILSNGATRSRIPLKVDT